MHMNKIKFILHSYYRAL